MTYYNYLYITKHSNNLRNTLNKIIQILKYLGLHSYPILSGRFHSCFWGWPPSSNTWARAWSAVPRWPAGCCYKSGHRWWTPWPGSNIAWFVPRIGRKVIWRNMQCMLALQLDNDQIITFYTWIHVLPANINNNNNEDQWHVRHRWQSRCDTTQIWDMQRWLHLQQATAFQLAASGLLFLFFQAWHFLLRSWKNCVPVRKWRQCNPWGMWLTILQIFGWRSKKISISILKALHGYALLSRITGKLERSITFWVIDRHPSWRITTPAFIQLDWQTM